MTAETITGTIKHIFSFFVPPLLNLLFLSIVIGESLGVGSHLQDFVAAIRGFFSGYIHTASDVIFSTTNSLIPNIKPDELAKFNPQAIIQTIINDVTSATKYVGFISMAILIFVSFVIDNLTLISSQIIHWIYIHITSPINKYISNKMPVNIPVAIMLQMYLSSFSYTIGRPSSSEARARAVFGHTTNKSLSRYDLWKIARAWLSKNANESFWLTEHNAANENTLNWKLSVDYARIYAAISILLYIYTLFKNPFSCWALYFQLQFYLFLYYYAAGTLSPYGHCKLTSTSFTTAMLVLVYRELVPGAADAPNLAC